MNPLDQDSIDFMPIGAYAALRVSPPLLNRVSQFECCCLSNRVPANYLFLICITTIGARETGLGRLYFPYGDRDGEIRIDAEA
jgi:hypothetical protein